MHFLLVVAALAAGEARPTDALPCRLPAPIVIAHRGASGDRPEHTLEAYRLAVEHGADFIEADLVMTADGILVARHENEISTTTDVAERAEFAARRTTRMVDGRPVSGWFSEDFTLAELKTLRARERLPQLRPANTQWDGQFDIPTLREVIALAQDLSRVHGRPIGLYPELKHPSHFTALGLPMEAALVEALHASGYDDRAAPIFIQSFEVGVLQRLRKMTPLRLIQLIDDQGSPFDRSGGDRPLLYSDMATPRGLAEIASYADGIGPAKSLVVPFDETGAQQPATGLITEARKAGLAVHPWTFRSENQFLPNGLRNNAGPRAHGDHEAEYRLFYSLGVDGVFTDFPAHAIAARETRQGVDPCAGSRSPARFSG